jgi:hypothetical protein
MRSVAAASATPRARGAFRATAALPVLLLAGFATVQRLALSEPAAASATDAPQRAGLSAERARALSADLCRAVAPTGTELAVGTPQPYYSGRGDGWDVDCTVQGRETEYVRMSWDAATGRLVGVDGGGTRIAAAQSGAKPRPLTRPEQAAAVGRALVTALRPDIATGTGGRVSARRFGDNWFVLLGAAGGSRATVSLAAGDGAVRFARFSPEPPDRATNK